MGSRKDVEVGGDCAFKSLSNGFVMAYVSECGGLNFALGLTQSERILTALSIDAGYLDFELIQCNSLWLLQFLFLDYRGALSSQLLLASLVRWVATGTCQYLATHAAHSPAL